MVHTFTAELGKERYACKGKSAKGNEILRKQDPLELQVS
ncbi:hypothetical protein E2C01_076559 [Portunus trituberculatus]|uniref:Uncharacterized protein n=1 Tax=Portunus trituberculatus TaxID=210409 RepID=A0A5B7IJ41_PORTR|nr:hypothetical protein [Portunus trituberculatus]